MKKKRRGWSRGTTERVGLGWVKAQSAAYSFSLFFFWLYYQVATPIDVDYNIYSSCDYSRIEQRSTGMFFLFLDFLI
jgi:hypothetical protein